MKRQVMEEEGGGVTAKRKAKRGEGRKRGEEKKCVREKHTDK